MSASYARHLRAYAWVLVVAFAVVILLRSGMEIDGRAGWEMLPDSCQTPTACSADNPTR